MPEKLTAENFSRYASQLSACDPDFNRIISEFDHPPFWRRPVGFATLVHVILEQQVSLASAKATFDKLKRYMGTVTADGFLQLEAEVLRGLGFSRQKARYCRLLAEAVRNKEIDLRQMENEDTVNVRTKLTAIKGIGRWTADTYLLIAGCRADVWPTGDLALLKAMKILKNLKDIPGKTLEREISNRWRPYRAVAARLLWHLYLSNGKNGTLS